MISVYYSLWVNFNSLIYKGMCSPWLSEVP